MGFKKNSNNQINDAEIDAIVISICESCGNAKVEAINKIRSKTGLGLIDAKKLVDNYHKARIKGEVNELKVSKIQVKNSVVQSEKEELANYTKLNLSITSGYDAINTYSKTVMYQTENGEVFFQASENEKYIIVNYSWAGPRYKTETHSHTVGTSNGKTKRKGRLIGAVVGTVIAPGIGTAIGAAHGTGNKKSKGTTNSQTTTYDNQVEINTPASIKLKNIKTGKTVGLTIICNSFIDSEINRFTFADELSNDRNTETIQKDPYEELKKAKELLDMGILTQDEFDVKKKELLGL